MEKEPQPDSLSEVTVKQYAASEVYSTEPPPAYHRPQSTSVQIARIAAITLVAVSFVLGGFILAAAYVNANASCQHLQQELQLLQDQADRYQPLQPEALTQEETQQSHRHHSTETHAEQKEDKDLEDNSISSSEETSSEDTSEEEDPTPIHIKLPLHLDLDELAGALMDKNQRSRMNCVVEKKKAEEVVDHQPKTVRLPFGLNLTTDPRYERVIGERMVIICEGGEAEQRAPPQQEETMMIQPLIVPLPGPVNLPLQFQGHMQPQPVQNALPQPEVRTHTIIMEQIPSGAQAVPVASPHGPPTPHQLPPHPLMQHIAQQIIAQHEMAAAAHREDMMRQRQEEQVRQREQVDQIRKHQEMMRQAEQMEGIRRQQEIARQREMEKHQEMMRQREMENVQRIQEAEAHRQAAIQKQQQILRHQEMMQQQAMLRHQELINRQQAILHQQQRQSQQDKSAEASPEIPHPMQGILVSHIPEEILSQVNRLPNQDVVVAVSEHEAEEIPQEDVRVVQHPRESAQEINGRQSYARGLPVHIPVPMMQQMQAPQQEEQARPHYVQPRSVRSVDALLHREKRVKRCACDCAC